MQARIAGGRSARILRAGQRALSEIEGAITGAAEGAGCLDERNTVLLEKAIRITIDVESRFGGRATDYADRAVIALENARRNADPVRQAKIDAAIEYASHGNHHIPIDTRINGLAFLLADEFGGQPAEYMMRAERALIKEKRCRGKRAGVICG